MANQEMRGHSSQNILNLRKRLPKCWAWVDQVLSPKYQKDNIKKEVVLALLNKSLPTKLAGPDEGEGKPIFDHYGKLAGEELNRIEAEILRAGLPIGGATRN